MDIIRLSKALSFALRHKPENYGLILDENGYAKVADIIEQFNACGKSIDFATLDEIVKNDAKTRFSFNEDKTRVRANYGHTFPVDLTLEEVKPTGDLYHGTAERFLPSIRKSGLKKGKRNFVHLSSDVSIAEEVGKRHGKPVVLTIDARKMVKDGWKIYRTNGQYLTESVGVKYIKELRIDKSKKNVDYEMTIINPKLCKSLTIQIELNQRNAETIPYVLVYHDKTRNLNKCSYIRLDKAEYEPFHKRKYLTKKQKDEFIKVMTSGWKMPRENSSRSGYDKAVDIWIDTFEPDEEKGIKKFNVNDNGAYIMPDYTKLETCS